MQCSWFFLICLNTKFSPCIRLNLIKILSWIYFRNIWEKLKSFFNHFWFNFGHIPEYSAISNWKTELNLKLSKWLNIELFSAFWKFVIQSCYSKVYLAALNFNQHVSKLANNALQLSQSSERKIWQRRVFEFSKHNKTESKFSPRSRANPFKSFKLHKKLSISDKFYVCAIKSIFQWYDFNYMTT